MRKIIILVICIFALVPIVAFTQTDCPEKKLYKFTGKILEMEFDTSGSSVLIKTKIEIQITNISNKNLIFWNRDSSETIGENKIVRDVVSKSETFTEQDIIDTHFGGASDFYGKSWDELRISLDKSSPPDEKTFTLKPNQTWTFSTNIGVVVRKKNLGELQKVWVKFHYCSWSHNIEPKAKYRATDLVFGKSLQKRWILFGNLVLEELVSEPIMFDLSSTGMKVVEK